MYDRRKVTKNSISLEKALFWVRYYSSPKFMPKQSITMDEHWKKKENEGELSFQTENEQVTLYIVLQDS